MTDGKFSISLPDLSARQVVQATLVVGLVAFGFWLVFRFHQAFLILLAGVILSVALKPAVIRLQRLGLPPWAGMALIFALLGLLAVLFLVYGVPLISQQVATIAGEMNRLYGDLRENLVRASNLILKRLAESLPAEPAFPGGASQSGAASAVAGDGSGLRQGLAVLGGAANVAFQIGAIFVLAFFWTLEAERIKRSGLLLLPRQRRDSAREFIQAIEERVSAYVSGQLLLAAIIGGLALLAYVILGVPNALVLGLLMAIMELIPVVGPILGAIPAVVIAFSVSPTMAIWVVVALVIIHQLEANVIGPRVMRRAMDIRPMVTLLALAAFGSLFGILGALVALPLASILQLILDRSVLDISPSDNALADRSGVGVIRYEIQSLIEDARKAIRVQEGESIEATEQIEDLIEALAVDLDSILAQTSEEQEAA